MAARTIAGLIAAAALAMVPAVAAPATATKPCFGAAARDPARPCDNPSLHYSARPSPAWAPLELNAPCHPLAYTHVPRVCWFAHRRKGSSATVALLGDSHASSWRSSVAVLARSRRWHALTIRRSSCPFNEALRTSPPKESASCAQWVHATIRWFGKHPEIHTLLVTASAYSGVVTPDGEDPYTVAVDGYRAALAALPATIRRVIVLRDTPRAAVGTLDCVARALRAHQDLTGMCPLARDEALAPDPGAEAAQQLGAPRFQVIDLSDFFCDPDTCHPVVGGALVYKDISHMTTVFGTSLGPYLTSAYLHLTR
jgi:SGNH domain (fused to AT3 domains)